MKEVTLALAKDLSATIRAGHPWIYGRALHPGRERLAAGQLVSVTAGGAWLARGYVDPTSPIAVRVLSRERDEIIDAGWVERRAERAAGMRRDDPTLAGTTGRRLIHGENDLMPGLVLDLYDTTGVAAFDGAGSAALWRPHLAAVIAGCRAGGATLERLWGRAPGREAAGEPLWGDAPPDPVLIDEHGARFEVDVRRGQKTGLFLDMRENRRLIGRLAGGGELLNLFGYTGGFSVHAALGGARRVTTVDLAAPAIAAAVRNFALNQLDPAAHEPVAADAFEFLAEAAARGRRWEIVICDPPSFAPSEKAKPQALRAYRRLNELALAVVAPGGLLISASCSSHISVDDLLAVVADAASRAQRVVRVRHIAGAGSDHPVLPAFPEGRYLKLFVVHAE